jgi:hypothetical protein
MNNKAEALAVEALAHLLLSECETMKNTVGNKRMQFFECSLEDAQKACEKAITVVRKAESS